MRQGYLVGLTRLSVPSPGEVQEGSIPSWQGMQGDGVPLREEPF